MFGPDRHDPSAPHPRRRARALGPARLEPLEPRVLLAFAFFGQDVASGLSQPAAVVTADFDGNGAIDVAVANASGNNITVLIGAGNGSFVEAPARPAVGSAPRAIAAGDLDGDGLIDLVAANSLSNSVTILRNAGGGTFQAGVSVAVGGSPRAVVVGDFNGDGRRDLGVALFDSDQVAVLLNTGGGGFGAPTLVAVGDGPVAITAADLDGDGDLDLATANITSGNATVLRNNGAGAFAGAGSHAVGSVPRAIAAADLNGDGAADLVVANAFSGTVSVLMNLGTGSLAPQAAYLAGNQPHGVALADFDGDGDVDIATSNVISGDVTVLGNNGAGVLAMPESFAAASGSIALAAADFDADVDPDLVVVSSLGNSVRLLRSGAAPENVPPVIDSVAASPAPAVAGRAITLTAMGVEDPDGAVTQVRFYRDSNGDGLLNPSDEALLPVDTDGADGWSWGGTAQASWGGGTVRLFAQAFDNAGRAGNLASAEVALRLPPTITFLGATPNPVEPGQTITLTASGAADADGSVQSVRFYRDANGNGLLDDADSELSPPDTDGADGYTWSGAASPSWGPGLVRFFARATDDEGYAGNAAGVVVTQSYRPTIAAAAASPSPLIFGDAVTLTATGVADQDGTVVAVQFYADVDANGVLEPGTDLLLGTDSTGGDGYSVTTKYPAETGPTGTLRFFARAVDNYGVPSLARAFTVPLRYRPEVGALVPDQFEIEPGSRLTLIALASDFDGAVASVAFYRDSNGDGVLDAGDALIGTDTTGGNGYSAFIDLDPELAAGVQRYFARATDDQGLLSNVAAADVLVNRRPTTDGFFASPEPIYYFDQLLLNANAFDADGEVEAVLFYRDTDADGQVSEGDEFLGEGTPEPELGYVLTTPVSPSWGPGQSVFIAVVRDDLGSLSEPAFATVTVLALPQVDALVASPGIVPRMTPFTLTAVGARYDGGAIGSVSFYRDSDGDGELGDSDELLGTDSDATGGWSTAVAAGASWPRGSTVFFAVAVDSLGELMSPAASTVAVIGSPPVIASLQAQPQAVSAGETLTLTGAGVGSGDGVIEGVLFYRDADFDGELDAEELAAPIAGSAVGGGAWRAMITAQSSWAGMNRFFAVAVDDIGLTSVVRSVLVTVTPPPVVDSLTVSPAQPVIGQRLTLTALLDDQGGPARSVVFYRDSNASGVLDDGDEALTPGNASGANAYEWTGIVPESWGPGAVTFFAAPIGLSGVRAAATAVSTEAWTRLFFPEGWRNDTTVNEYLPVVNPNAFTVRYRVIARYEVGERDQVIFDGEIAPYARGGLIVTERGRADGALTRANVGYAIEVQSSAPLGAMLSRYDNFSGQPGAATDAANGEALTSTTSTVWSFADVRREPGSIFDFLVYYNPTETDGRVTFDLYYEDGSRVSFTYDAAALRRGGVNFNAEGSLPAGRFAVVATSTVPLVIAQSRYEAATGEGFSTLGDPSGGSMTHLVPFVETRAGVRNELAIFNPGDAAANVTITASYESEPTALGGELVSLTLDPGRPAFVSLDELPLLAGGRASLRVQSDVPVIVRQGAADAGRGDATATVPGGGGTSTGWLFADAFLDSATAGTVGFEYLTLSNPGSEVLTVMVYVYSAAGGEPVSLSLDLEGGQTRTIDVHADGAIPLVSGLNFFALGAFAESPFVAVFTHWDLFQNGGWATAGTPASMPPA